MKLREKYIVDKNGERKAVVLDIKEYEKLKEEIENRNDALDIERAKREAKGFTALEEFIKELKKEEKI